MMKRTVAVLVALLMLTVCLSACGGETPSSSEPKQDTSVPTVDPAAEFEDMFAPTAGSTAVATTPMDAATARQPVGGSTRVTLNNLFQDYAVLQRDAKVPVWGTGENGKTVTVEFAGQSKTATVADGKWRVDLDPMEASTVNRQMVVTSGDTVLVANNILVGEVWLASGQSNMAMSLFNYGNDIKRQLLQEKDNDSLREMCITIERSVTPKTDPVGMWLAADTTKNIISISGVVYYFAKELQKSLGVPIGVIRAAESATEIELWVDTDKVEARGFSNPLKPLKAETDYKAMIMPLFPYAVKGMIWYQGEDNIVCEYSHATYQNTFSVLMEDYRAGFENPDLPIIQVMLPRYVHQNEPAWIHFRYVQMGMQDAFKNVYTAVTLDTGEPEDIHPKADKPIVSARLAAIALDRVYGVGQPALSPVASGCKVSGDKITVSFRHIVRGLTVRGDLTDIEVRDAQGTWHQASAQVGADGATLVVSAAGITPTAVRYANVSVPSGALYDKNGLPVAPFCLEA